MGFFSGLSKAVGGVSGLFGGEEQSQATPASGFYSLPLEYQKLFTNVANKGNKLLLGKGGANLFTPMEVTDDEAVAFDALRGGFAPTEESLRADRALFENPFNSSVINAINQEAKGENSLVNQYATQAGQQGSNRSFLGTSDVEQKRLDSIGQFRQGQYNKTIDDIFSKLIPTRQSDAQNLLNIGSFERNLDSATRQAPYTALQAAGGLVGGLPTSFGTSSQAANVSSGSSTGDTLSKVSQGLQIAGTIAGFFSDERLKENFEFEGVENGHNVYSYNYIGEPDQRYIGVKAQEVKDKNMDAVFVHNGKLAVHYDRIGVEHRKVV